MSGRPADFITASAVSAAFCRVVVETYQSQGLIKRKKRR
jgi:hypothetical protein